MALGLRLSADTTVRALRQVDSGIVAVHVDAADLYESEDPTLAAEVEYWPTLDPTRTHGSREQKLAAYREVCDQLLMRIRKRFARASAASG